MAHPRKLIRQAVVALLASAGTAAGARVEDTRVDPHKKTELPAIAVYTPREESELVEGSAPRELLRGTELVIAGFVGNNDPTLLAAALDDLAEEIEAAMDADPNLSRQAEQTFLESTDIEIRAEDGRSDPLVGIVKLTYSVAYRTSPAPPANLDEFLTVDAELRIPEAVEANQAEDQFSVRP